jgi:hypothetical protein
MTRLSMTGVARHEAALHSGEIGKHHAVVVVHMLNHAARAVSHRLHRMSDAPAKNILAQGINRCAAQHVLLLDEHCITHVMRMQGGRPSYGSGDRSPRRSSDRGSSGGRGGGSRGSRGGSYGSRRPFSTASFADVRSPLVVGGAVLDVMCKPAPGAVLVLETSNPGQVTQQFGGGPLAAPALVASLLY